MMGKTCAGWGSRRLNETIPDARVERSRALQVRHTVRRYMNTSEATRVGPPKGQVLKNFDSRSVCTCSSCLLWPTTLLDHILGGKKTQHEYPFKESDVGHDNRVLEDRLDLRTARPIPPTSQFREMVYPPRDIPSDLQTIAAVRDRVQNRTSAGRLRTPSFHSLNDLPTETAISHET